LHLCHIDGALSPQQRSKCFFVAMMEVHHCDKEASAYSSRDEEASGALAPEQGTQFDTTKVLLPTSDGN
jgi:hypothetical protein